MKFPSLKFSTAATLLALLAVAALFGQGLLHRGQYAAAPGPDVDPPSAFTAGEPNLVAAMFYSAWCSACALLDPKLRDVAPDFDGRAVQFVKFDFSMGPTQEQQQEAERLGIADTYNDNKGGTGFMLLVDRRSQLTLSAITSSMSREDIRDALNSAISKAAQPSAAEAAVAEERASLQ